MSKSRSKAFPNRCARNCVITIRMINIYPSATNTDIWNHLGGDWPRDKMIPADEVASAVAYALAQPPDVLIENITLGNLSGRL